MNRPILKFYAQNYTNVISLVVEMLSAVDLSSLNMVCQCICNFESPPTPIWPTLGFPCSQPGLKPEALCFVLMGLCSLLYFSTVTRLIPQVIKVKEVVKEVAVDREVQSLSLARALACRDLVPLSFLVPMPDHPKDPR
jgi:hypothetical protein